MGSRRDSLREAARERSPVRKALKARGLTLQDIIDDVETTAAANAYEHRIRDYLDTLWFASLQDLIGLKMDPAKILLQKEFGTIMVALGEPQQKILSDILQGEIAKLDRELVIQRLVKTKKVGRHKEKYLHRDVVTGSWKTVSAKIIQDLGMSGLTVVMDSFVNTIHLYELKVKKVGGGEVYGYLEWTNTKGNTIYVKYKKKYFKIGDGRVFRGTPRDLLVLVEITAPMSLDKEKRRKLGIKPRSRSLNNWLY